jgi:4-hydroxy-2-oxoheptanedioate aldolase
LSGAVPSSFRERVTGGETLFGAFVNLGSSLVTEIMGTAGLDWLVIDLEHGAGDEVSLLHQLQALGASDTAALVRVEAIEPARFLHALDLGADGVLVPRLRSVEDARECAALCRYSGSRGVARSTRNWGWGTATRALTELDAEIVCAVQIETVEALEAVDEIAAVDGVDILFVGPLDLSHALGLPQPDHPELLERVAAVARAAAENGKVAGVLVASIDQVRLYKDLGFTFIGCGSDGVLLTRASRQMASRLREL